MHCCCKGEYKNADFLYALISKIGLTFWQLRVKPMACFIWPWCLPGGYSARAIKECIDYELKSAENPYVLTNFCKLLSWTYYTLKCYGSKSKRSNIKQLNFWNPTTIMEERIITKIRSTHSDNRYRFKNLHCLK